MGTSSTKGGLREPGNEGATEKKKIPKRKKKKKIRTGKTSDPQNLGGRDRIRRRRGYRRRESPVPLNMSKLKKAISAKEAKKQNPGKKIQNERERKS